MGKKFAFQLQLVNPCTENWDKMTPNEQGRHCDNCNKTVIDFTQYTDCQLIEFFKKAKDGICGRATKLQMQRQYVYAEPNKYPFLSKFVFGTTLLAGLTGTAAAQSTTTPTPTHQTDEVKSGLDAANPSILIEVPLITEIKPAEIRPLIAISDTNTQHYMLGGMIGVVMPMKLEYDSGTNIGYGSGWDIQVLGKGDTSLW